MRAGRRLFGGAVIAIAMAGGAPSAHAAQPVGKLLPVQAAQPASLELKDTTGKLHRIADYRGKVVLVNFWATWCEPCRDEMPSMQALHLRLGPGAGGDVIVLAVNHAENLPRIEQFLQKLPLSFPILIDGFSEVWRAWKPGMLPASYLIGRDGRIRYRVLGEFDWSGADADAAVRRLLAEKTG